MCSTSKFYFKSSFLRFGATSIRRQYAGYNVKSNVRLTFPYQLPGPPIVKYLGTTPTRELHCSAGQCHQHQNFISPNLPNDLGPGFSFWPAYLSLFEQRILLSAALHRIDSTETVIARRRRLAMRPAIMGNDENLESLFAPDELYDFQEGHYDGVIHRFREMHLTSWPLEQFSGLNDVLERLYRLCPSPEIQTHLLHLASDGEILPHVDNLTASGSWILGVSLGAERILSMERVDAMEGNHTIDLALPSGSVYLQRDDIRYSYKHSIQKRIGNNEPIGHGQRLSVVFRDLPPR